MSQKICKPILLTAIMVFFTVINIADTWAAKDGQIGATSTAYTKVTLSIPPRIQINNIRDINLGLYQDHGDLYGNTNLCIYTNGVDGYKVNVSNAEGAGSDFQIFNQSQLHKTVSLPMEVSWSNKFGPTESKRLKQNTAVKFDKMAKSDCGAQDYNANLSVNVKDEHLRAAPSGIYSTHLAVMVEPL